MPFWPATRCATSSNRASGRDNISTTASDTTFLPTRAGRHGQAWTWDGPLNLKNARFAEDQDPLDAAIPCPASSGYSKAYLHHLIRADEILGKVLLSWHNIAFYQALTAAMRAAISEGRFEQFRRDFHARHTSNG